MKRKHKSAKTSLSKLAKQGMSTSSRAVPSQHEDVWRDPPFAPTGPLYFIYRHAEK